jgi:hypothetical protein
MRLYKLKRRRRRQRKKYADGRKRRRSKLITPELLAIWRLFIKPLILEDQSDFGNENSFVDGVFKFFRADCRRITSVRAITTFKIVGYSWFLKAGSSEDIACRKVKPGDVLLLRTDTGEPERIDVEVEGNVYTVLLRDFSRIRLGTVPAVAQKKKLDV